MYTECLNITYCREKSCHFKACFSPSKGGKAIAQCFAGSRFKSWCLKLGKYSCMKLWRVTTGRLDHSELDGPMVLLTIRQLTLFPMLHSKHFSCSLLLPYCCSFCSLSRDSLSDRISTVTAYPCEWKRFLCPSFFTNRFPLKGFHRMLRKYLVVVVALT